MRQYKVAIIGATGIVGQRLVCLLDNHPWFEPVRLLASGRSAGKLYPEAVENRWAIPSPLPDYAKKLPVLDASDPENAGDADFVFCAVNLPKMQTLALEESYARRELPVISNSSACRLIPDVPMIIPEVNHEHLAVIPFQRRRLRTKKGFIAVKSNCTLQSYVPLLSPLRCFGLEKVSVCTYQAVSGAGKTLSSMPEILDNVIPFISGEEEKSEIEPLKLWGKIEKGKIVPADAPLISAQCVRVPVSDGHLAAVSVSFRNKPSRGEILSRWEAFGKQLALPSAPKKMIHYFEESDRPQSRLDRELENGMAISAGRLRDDSIFDYKFFGLSHNTLRGAAGGAVLLAELLAAEGYLD